MKPFDREAAQNGAKVQTRNGRDVRLLCFDKRGNASICGLVDMGTYEELMCWDEDGSCFSNERSYYDLTMAPVKKTLWANLHKGSDGVHFMDDMLLDTEELARKFADHNASTHVKTFSIEVEE